MSMNNDGSKSERSPNGNSTFSESNRRNGLKYFPHITRRLCRSMPYDRYTSFRSNGISKDEPKVDSIGICRDNIFATKSTRKCSNGINAEESPSCICQDDNFTIETCDQTSSICNGDIFQNECYDNTDRIYNYTMLSNQPYNDSIFTNEPYCNVTGNHMSINRTIYKSAGNCNNSISINDERTTFGTFEIPVNNAIFINDGRFTDDPYNEAVSICGENIFKDEPQELESSLPENNLTQKESKLNQEKSDLAKEESELIQEKYVSLSMESIQPISKLTSSENDFMPKKTEFTPSRQPEFNPLQILTALSETESIVDESERIQDESYWSEFNPIESKFTSELTPIQNLTTPTMSESIVEESTSELMTIRDPDPSKCSEKVNYLKQKTYEYIQGKSDWDPERIVAELNLLKEESDCAKKESSWVEQEYGWTDDESRWIQRKAEWTLDESGYESGLSQEEYGRSQEKSGWNPDESGSAEGKSGWRHEDSGWGQDESGWGRDESGWGQDDSGWGQVESGSSEDESGWSQDKSGWKQDEPECTEVESGRCHEESGWFHDESSSSALEFESPSETPGLTLEESENSPSLLVLASLKRVINKLQNYMHRLKLAMKLLQRLYDSIPTDTALSRRLKGIVKRKLNLVRRNINKQQKTMKQLKRAVNRYQ